MNNFYTGFSIEDLEKLIYELGWKSLEIWKQFWQRDENIFLITKEFYGNNFKDNWMWGIVLPLLSDIYRLSKFKTDRKIIGLSALPGTGKTSLGKLLENLSPIINLNVSVISLDDFYLPSDEMNKITKDNPWGVSRGFPGTHSINLLHEKLLLWKELGQLDSPVFDKSLRFGLGDRSHWRKESPDLIILEGWFLGIKPVENISKVKEFIDPPLTSSEINYRIKIQNNLENYLKIWELIDNLWHIKPLAFNYVNDWKTYQEKKMLKEKGFALKDKKLKEFLRMLNTAIPQSSFDNINSNVLTLINNHRKILKISFKNINKSF